MDEAFGMGPDSRPQSFPAASTRERDVPGASASSSSAPMASTEPRARFHPCDACRDKLVSTAVSLQWPGYEPEEGRPLSFPMVMVKFHLRSQCEEAPILSQDAPLQKKVRFSLNLSQDKPLEPIDLSQPVFDVDTECLNGGYTQPHF
jgi:hypothetical protein